MRSRSRDAPLACFGRCCLVPRFTEVNVPVAKRYSTLWTDDLDGSVAATTLEFSLDGVAYAIDLSEANALRMRSCFEPYIRAASKASRSLGRTVSLLEQPSFERPQTHARQAREWLRLNGHEVGSRGRLPQELLQRYESARDGALGMSVQTRLG